MRRLLSACLLAFLLLPAATAAAHTRAAGDGTLSVKNGWGTISIAARGTVIGSCDSCRITVVDPKPEDGTGPIVSGYERRNDLSENTNDPDDVKATWRGEDVKFRLIGGFFRLIVRGRGIELTAVARGSGTIKAHPTAIVVGTYALNGGERKPLPLEIRPFQLVDNEPPPE